LRKQQIVSSCLAEVLRADDCGNDRNAERQRKKNQSP